jgi:dTDP-4-amino-4,6-dideoxygalactose transaminase
MILFEDRAATVLYNVLSKIKNKKFLLPLNICPIVPDTFLRAGKEFEFVDIDTKTLSMDENTALNMIKNDNSIDGVLFVKTFGVEFESETFYKKIKELNQDVFIIDDMCPAIQKFDWDIENSHAQMALFSSGYSKFVDIGYGGYGFVKDDIFKGVFEDKQKTKEFMEYKNIILAEIPKMIEHKSMLNQIYSQNIDPKYHLGEEFNNWRFSILVDNKQEILDDIFKTDTLFASSHYPQVDFEYKTDPIKNSNTHKIHSKIINLFNDFRYTKDKTYKTIDIINKHLK